MASISGASPASLSSPFVCLTGVAALAAVYHDGSDHVGLADATTAATSPAVGIVVRKPTSTTCILVYKGEVGGFIGLVPAAVYYLDVIPGGITATPTSATGTILQRIGWARNTTTLVVEIDLDYQQL